LTQFFFQPADLCRVKGEGEILDLHLKGCHGGGVQFGDALFQLAADVSHRTHLAVTSCSFSHRPV
jgi:hypothetical protein